MKSAKGIRLFHVTLHSFHLEIVNLCFIQMLGRSKKLRKHRKPKSKVWKPLRIQDFKSLMQLYISAISIVGFFPYKIESSKFVFSRGRFIWSKFVLIIYICCSIVASYQINFDVNYQNVSVLLRTDIGTFLGIVIILVTGFRSRSKLQVFQRLSDVSRILPPQFFAKLPAECAEKTSYYSCY